ncbi:E2F-associated phosphoprotein [Cynoglossus semilaevis]|uniref:E2f-associated phosphoprotein n=1 Tax=Cynoglossus semilaevis TaxID=244447 RepID=A0A3P8VSB5_CYNSE|nr:E2F-associated phosphoprotein [Cynoglossus semilaevis]
MEKTYKFLETDSYVVEENSDEDSPVSSSEDELEILLNGTPDQKKKLIREYLTGESESSSGDEFEKEMEAELSCTIKTMEGSWKTSEEAGAEGAHTAEDGGGGGASNPQLYDKVYFDSDSDDEDTPSSSKGSRSKQRVIPTNDELLYDPDEDDRDQAWVDARRRLYAVRKRPAAAMAGSSQTRKCQGLPSSDAVLNCPACMTTLCLDCQRHEKYRTQYRAMFVMNCTVKTDEVLRYKTQQDSKQKRRRKGRNQKKGTTESELPDPTPSGMNAGEVYHPVQCSECFTEVAVYDKEEVYHFFNILASHC